MIGVPDTDKFNVLTVEEAVYILRQEPERKMDLMDAQSREHLARWLEELQALRKFRAHTEEARRYLP